MPLPKGLAEAARMQSISTMLRAVAAILRDTADTVEAISDELQKR